MKNHILPLVKAHALMGIKPSFYSIMNIINIDRVNSFITECCKLSGNEIIFVFDTHTSPYAWMECSSIYSEGKFLVKFSEGFSFYYDVEFFNMLKMYSEGGYMVFLLYKKLPQGIILVNAVINWSPRKFSLSEEKWPQGYDVINIDDVGISSEGKIKLGTD